MAANEREWTRLVSPDTKDATNSVRMLGEPLTHRLVGPIPLRRVCIEPVVFWPSGIHVFEELLPVAPRPTLQVPLAGIPPQRRQGDEELAGVLRGVPQTDQGPHGLERPNPARASSDFDGGCNFALGGHEWVSSAAAVRCSYVYPSASVIQVRILAALQFSHCSG